MAIIKLKVNDKILVNVLWLLKQFNQDELEIIESDLSFEGDKNYVQNEFERLESGDSTLYSIEEVDEILEKLIREYEG